MADRAPAREHVIMAALKQKPVTTAFCASRFLLALSNLRACRPASIEQCTYTQSAATSLQTKASTNDGIFRTCVALQSTRLWTTNKRQSAWST
eukprot:1039076-Amphidinium_carterae.1